MNSILEQTTFATVAAYLGGILAVASARVMERHLRAAVFAAMGVLLAVTLFDILPEAYKATSPVLFLVGVGSGFLLFWFLSVRVAPICPACVVGRRGRVTVAPLALIFVLVSLHSTMDGLALAVSNRLSGHVDVMTLTAICLHKVPEGIALALLALGSGMRPYSALVTVFAVEFTTEIGGVAGILLLHHGAERICGLIFAHVGGGFLYLIGTVFLSNLSSKCHDVSHQKNNAASLPVKTASSDRS